MCIRDSPRVLCSSRVKCENSAMKYVIVRCEELGGEEAFLLENGEAYVPVVSKNTVLFFQDCLLYTSASYAEAMKESGLDIVSRPEVTIEKIGKDEPFVYSALVAVKPEVTLGQYKGVEVEKADASVSAEDVEAELKKVQEQNARLLTVEDRGVEDGDQTVIDFEGFVDGKGFEGGKAEDYPLTIGSHSFIDTFEEQLIGKKIEMCIRDRFLIL